MSGIKVLYRHVQEVPADRWMEKLELERQTDEAEARLGYPLPRRLRSLFSSEHSHTVRVEERGENALICLVTDPGTSDYQANDRVKIALPDADSQAEAEQVGAGEGTLYRVSFLPDQGAEFINPAQWTALEDE